MFYFVMLLKIYNLGKLHKFSFDNVFYLLIFFPFRCEKMFDTIIMNPPFGTKHNAGMDVQFLKQAFKMSKNTVYSLHKTSTRHHILKVAESCGVKGEVLAEMKYDLPSTYKFHKKSSVDICVDFLKFQVT